MTRITNADQVLMLLRSHLERAKKSDRKSAAAKQGRPGALERAQQLASAEGLSEADVARALIAGLLAEEFGAELAAEPRFQAMVEEVRLMLESDEAGRLMLRDAVTQLAGGR